MQKGVFFYVSRENQPLTISIKAVSNAFLWCCSLCCSLMRSLVLLLWMKSQFANIEIKVVNHYYFLEMLVFRFILSFLDFPFRFHANFCWRSEWVISSRDTLLVQSCLTVGKRPEFPIHLEERVF